MDGNESDTQITGLLSHHNSVRAPDTQSEWPFRDFLKLVYAVTPAQVGVQNLSNKSGFRLSPE